MTTTKAAKLLKVNLVLFILAAAIAAYMVWHHYELVNGTGGFSSFCSINQTIDCDAVNASRYSELAGVPLAAIGLGYSLFAIAVTVMGVASSYGLRDALALLLPLSALSVLASLAALGVSAFALHKWCLMCASMQLLNLGTFLVTVFAARAFSAGNCILKELSQANRKTFGTWLGVGAAVMVVTQLLTSQLREDRPFDVEQFVNDYRAQPMVDLNPGDSPRLGYQGPNPPVQIIEFADFQCPACGFAAHQMHRLLMAYGDTIQLVFKNYPLDQSCNPSITHPMHEYACFAAKTALCAAKQGKFEALFEKLYGNQAQINRDNIESWARELGLNMTELDNCVSAPETDAAIKTDVAMADKAGLNSTPTFFVAGRMVRGPIDEPRLKALLRELGK